MNKFVPKKTTASFDFAAFKSPARVLQITINEIFYNFT